MFELLCGESVARGEGALWGAWDCVVGGVWGED